MTIKEYKPFLSAFFVIAAGGLLFYFTKPFLPSKLFTENQSSENIIVDSLMINAMKDFEEEKDPIIIEIDSIKTDSVSTQKDSPLKKNPSQDSIVQQQIALVSTSNLIEITDFNYNLEHPVDSTGSLTIPQPVPFNSYQGVKNLKRFFEKLYELEQSKKGKVRIAYYGDSMIDGDLIVQDFRSALQSRFGGRGVGFVSIKSESARSRYSVKHYINGNWEQKNFMTGSADSIPYGVNGAVFFPEDSTASVTYLASGIKNSARLNSPKLFYGTGSTTAILKVREEKDTILKKIKLDGNRKLNTIALSSNNLKRIELDFSNALKTPIYGIDFSDATGIAVDGFSNRGNSGLPLSLLHISQMKRFDTTLDYDLIILQYGANVLTRTSKSYNWYKSRMTKVVQHLQLAFPNADILILGTADRGTKIENTIKTDTSVVKLLRSQQEYAAITQSGFISLFHLMGGVNSMPVWTDKKLANNDFTHFSSQGSRKIGRLLYGELMDGYSAFAKARTQQNLELEKQIKERATDSLKVENDSIKNQLRP